MLAGCPAPGSGGDEQRQVESFEDGIEDWETATHIGPEEDLSDFECAIERTRE